MSDTLVKVENISKKFCRSLKKSLWYGLLDLGHELTGSLRDDCLRPDEFWAVRGVSFELKRGECLGLIGPNGAGKTTLLKMLNGLVRPDGGRIDISGRVGALIALGAGFNPILTGRENIYINATVLGLGKREIDNHLDKIIEFAELNDFIDSPVQTYSSGMHARLGFSIAIAVQPDILLIDEVLAVGDASFRFKAYRAIADLLPHSAVILVSHSLPQVAKVATRAMLLKQGRSAIDSPDLNQVFDVYQSQQQTRALNITETSGISLYCVAASAGVDGAARIANSAPGHVLLNMPRGASLNLEFGFRKSAATLRFHAAMDFVDNQENIVAQAFSIHQVPLLEVAAEQSFNLKFELSDLPLRRGNYTLNLRIYDSGHSGRAPVCLYLNVLEIRVSADGATMGAAPIQFQALWQTDTAMHPQAFRQLTDALFHPT